MSDTSGIQLLDSCHHILEVIATTALVAAAPSEDAGMVAECAHLALVAFNHRSTEQFDAAQTLITVALHISFRQNVKSVFVAQLIEIGIVGVVASTHGIDVQALHAEHILQHLFLADRAARFLTEVMAVHSVEDNPVAVDKQSAVVADADGAEAYLAATQVYHLFASHQRQR